MNATFTIDLNKLCARCHEHHAISGTQLCPHCTADDPVFTPPAPPRRERAPHKSGSGLSGSMFDLIMRTEKSADRQFHALLLPRGLTIEVGIGEEFNLRLARLDCTPSIVEWQTVIAALPAAYRPETAVTPREFKHTARDGTAKWYLEDHWQMKRSR